MTKVSALEGPAPRTMAVDDGEVSEENASSQGVRLKKELSLMNGVAIIVGVIVGSGIFVAPSEALNFAGSKGMALVVWFLAGMLALVGALCYAELGTMIPKSGGDYAYINEAFGELPAFLYLWVALFVLVPAGNAITALTFAKNILKPFWPDCHPPSEAVSLIGALITCLLTVMNCYNVKWVTRVQDSFTIAKIIALLLTFAASLWYVTQGHLENLQNMMEGTKSNPGDIAIAFYNGLFCYSGWNFLNFVTEELKDPYKNLPRAIYISMPIVTVVYTLTNVAFFAVLTSKQITSAEEVAVTFGHTILQNYAWVMPLLVVLCTLGSLNGAIYASSRLFFVGARNGHLPLAISLININRLTPIPSLIFMCFTTVVLLLAANVKSLIVYLMTVELIFTWMSVGGLLWLRYTQPTLHRPIRVQLWLPAVFLIIYTLLIVCSLFGSPYETSIGIIITALGVPLYYIFIKPKNKPTWLQSASYSFNLTCSKIFVAQPESSKEL